MLTPRDAFLDAKGAETLDLADAVSKLALEMTGDLTVDAGTLEFELHTATIGDQLSINGSLALDTMASTLSILDNPDVLPTTRGQVHSWTLITASEITGSFSNELYNNGEMGHVTNGLFVDTFATNTQIDLSLYLALPGDANGDGNVDVQDLIAWKSNKFTTGTDWTTGDFNGDGITDGQDFVVWNANKFTSVSRLVAIPEPATDFLVIASVLMCALVHANRKDLLRG